MALNRFAFLVFGIVLLAPGAAEACSFFMCARGGQVLAGNNEDYIDPDTLMWFEPAEKDKYGRVCFGFGNRFCQGGMNDQGLFFDGAATAEQKIEGRKKKRTFRGNIIDKAMRECATVDEVIELFESYDVPAFFGKAQLMFSDRSGDSVILEGDNVIRKKGDFQITTNFYQSEHRSKPCPCSRYRTIESKLAGDETPTVDGFRKILAAVHQEGKVSTVYSNIYDLKAGRIYLYHFHNFEQPVVIDLAAELKKGAHEVEIASLFEPTFAYTSFKERYVKSQAAK